MKQTQMFSIGVILINIFLLFFVIQSSYNWVLAPSFGLSVIGFKQSIALDVFSTPFLAYLERRIPLVGLNQEERLIKNIQIFSFLMTCFGMNLIWRLLIS